MYNEFFQLTEMPFAIEPNPRFIMLGEDHREALATLVYAIDQQEGWALLLGEAGVGKTTLIIALLRELKDRVMAAVITNPRLDVLDFFNVMALELGMEGPFRSKGQFLMALQQMIRRCRQEGKTLLLVIDEAHSLSSAMLEELRLLGNLDDSSPRVLNIFLVGQPELLQHLRQPEAKGLLQRLRRHYVLKPLDAKETAAYIRHRLEAAGGNPDIFDQEALGAVYEITKGTPRLVNSLCDDAMLLAFTHDTKHINNSLIMDSAKEDFTLTWPPTGEAKAKDQLAAETVPAPAEAGFPPPPSSEEPVGEQAGPKKRISNEASGAFLPQQAEEHSREEVREPKISVEPQIPPEPAPARTRPSPAPRKKKAPSPKTGAASRFAASLSRNAPGSMWKRTLVLILLVTLALGGYIFVKRGGYNFLQRQWWGLMGTKSRSLFTPQESTPGTKVAPKPRNNSGVKDWGPIVPAPARSADVSGGGRG